MLKLCFLLAVCLVAVRAQHCPEPWTPYNNKCYVYVDEVVAKTEAQTICHGYNGRLAEPRDEPTNSFLTDMLRNVNAENSWIGCSDDLKEGLWLYLSDSALVQASDYGWNGGEPNNAGDGEDCAVMTRSADYRWNDVPCSWHSAFICQRESLY